MYVLVMCVAALFVSAPILSALIVAVASRREDRSWSLDQPARSLVESVARRIVAFNADSIVWPRSKEQVQAEADYRTLDTEIADDETECGTQDAA